MSLIVLHQGLPVGTVVERCNWHERSGYSRRGVVVGPGRYPNRVRVKFTPLNFLWATHTCEVSFETGLTVIPALQLLAECAD